MKKSLSLIALAAVALFANAQQEKVWSNQEGLEALGLSSEASELAEQSVLAEGQYGKFMNAFTDNAKIMSISADNIKSVIVDGEEYTLTSGTTGSTNPAGVSIATPPTAGWVYQIDNIVEDGYITLFSKLSSNKAYYVFEGDANTGLLQTYWLSMYVDLGEGSKVYEYTLPGDEYGYFNMSLPDASVYSDSTSMRWPEKIFLGKDSADVKKNGFGVISFPVYKDAGTYLFCAQGSKANTNGFIFTKTEPKQIVGVVPEKTNEETGEVTPGKTVVFRGSAENGISSVAADLKADGAIYNVLGVKVDNNYKGLIIKNGKKYINR